MVAVRNHNNEMQSNQEDVKKLKKISAARQPQAHPPPPQARQCISGSMSEFMSEFMSKFMSKFTTQPSAPNLPIPVPSGRFKHIHVDLVGPLMASDEGYTHVMTMVNRTTRWMEVIPLS